MLWEIAVQQIPQYRLRVPGPLPTLFVGKSENLGNSLPGVTCLSPGRDWYLVEPGRRGAGIENGPGHESACHLWDVRGVGIVQERSNGLEQDGGDITVVPGQTRNKVARRLINERPRVPCGRSHGDGSPKKFGDQAR